MTIFHESFFNIISLFRNISYTFVKEYKFAKSKSGHQISPKFTGKHLYWSLLLSKVAGLLPVEPNHLFCFPKQMVGFYVKQAFNLIKNETSSRCFPVNFAKLLKTPLFIENLRWIFTLKKFTDRNHGIKTQNILILCLHNWEPSMVCYGYWLIWKVPKYKVFSCPYFPVFGLNTEI